MKRLIPLGAHFARFIMVASFILEPIQHLVAQPFKEISLQSKLHWISDNNGVAVADYDGDYDLDVFVVKRWDWNNSISASSQLLRNNNDGTFTDVTTTSGITSNHNYKDKTVAGMYSFGEKMGASWGDYDNDGFPDLFLTSALYYELYHNNQDGTFTNVTEVAGFVPDNNCYSTGALWFDYNNDTYLDLYITSVFNCKGKLYQNNGNGTFTDQTESLGLQNSGGASWMAIPWDINEDGFQDIYISRDFDVANEFFINNSGASFSDQAADYNLTDIGRDGMGLTNVDYNNDGLLDLYVTNIDESSLYRNLGTGSFINVSDSLGVMQTGWSWGVKMEDFDHDLDLDLMVVNGFYEREANRYYQNISETGVMGFEDRTDDFGMSTPSFSNGLATFDYDHDGDLDILVGRSYDQMEFFQNEAIHASLSNTKNWVQIKLEGTNSNRDAIGSVVKIKIGDLTLIRNYHGASLMAQSQQPVHFGLGDHDEIDLLTIKWPSGLTENYVGIPVNSFLKVTEGNGYEMLELSSAKISGCTDPQSCNYNSRATLDDGSCQYLDALVITGSSTSGVLAQQSYRYPYTDGSSYQWEVTNGTIVQGQGTSEILVKWGIADEGSVSVVEYGTDCKSTAAELPVDLQASSLPENVSVARLWVEVLLEAIRNDYARPTVHSRNLFHTSVAMYDAWAIFDERARTWLIGNHVGNYISDFTAFESDEPKDAAVEKAISHASYRLLTHRFKDAPHQEEIQRKFDELMDILGYDRNYTSTNYQNGNAAALGNYIAESIIHFGMIDGANESEKYGNYYYQPVNDPLVPYLPGNSEIQDPNRWQPLQLEVFIDQAGNPTAGNTPQFLSPEWGNVVGFSLQHKDAKTYERDGNAYRVYHDPGSPPALNERKAAGSDNDLYKWNFALVSLWSAQLDHEDGVTLDISPASMGNIAIDALPTRLEDHPQFYNLFDGGDIGTGRNINPLTGKSYEPQIVPRGDYTRVLAEFWADGPDSETPPGHWFVLMNYVNDHPEFQRKFKGVGDILPPLEWDVKAYFTLGGAMHDAAIVAWSLKGYYDYVRPISAIRYMADQGQSTDPSKENYHPNGLPLYDGFIETVEVGDPLAGDSNQHVGKIKLLAWRGHSYVNDSQTDRAGVGWILAENWWPYQRASFVTPPFAGYVSGHSTFSRAAAEVLTSLTGSEYFPGGMGEFMAKKNEFLVFEEGPSQDIILQWATYRDASDQCSLSRIWGGIHPPADDIPGRLLGARIGQDAFAFAEAYFNGGTVLAKAELLNSGVYPNPATDKTIYVPETVPGQEFEAFDIYGRKVGIEHVAYDPSSGNTTLSFNHQTFGLVILRSGNRSWKLILR